MEPYATVEKEPDMTEDLSEREKYLIRHAMRSMAEVIAGQALVAAADIKTKGIAKTIDGEMALVAFAATIMSLNNKVWNEEPEA